ncbi:MULTISPECIES: HIRAN domain-containing protein [Bacillus cereus group]|uniref:HIRAN domain-containing protein n=1 Tax=Bacillus cereus group TaxID=86661 RepID=UPI001F1C4648|nr:HIRAN domain-containing protein [Bacillus cereus]MDA1521234.1 HIRAN domain-containing protein [Bacillus cereus]BCC16558.1 hypothetical protein BCM0075_1328 [Bacillus cereus]HDR7981302.1 HIRAN domain-containing protein [Bacillus cereus]HDR8059622.1 HIRAN domain-containing protein [Bacillus cereus]HDR8220731.1 HIRAN domain-containing protein [Bacillus cereus]
MNSEELLFFKSSKVKGVSFGKRQETIARIDVMDRIVLRRERSNEYDRNAIAVYTIRNEQIGYIDKEASMELASVMDEGRKVAASISKIIGGSGYLYGLVLDLYIEKQKNYILPLIHDESQSIIMEFMENVHLSPMFDSQEIRFLQSVLNQIPNLIQSFYFISYFISENYKAGIDFTWDLLNHAEIIWYNTLLEQADFPKENLTPSYFINLLLTDLYFCFKVQDVVYLLIRLDNGETDLEEDVKVMLQQSSDKLARFFGIEFDHIYHQWELLVKELKE